jgi:hypothetical protein
MDFRNRNHHFVNQPTITADNNERVAILLSPRIAAHVLRVFDFIWH